MKCETCGMSIIERDHEVQRAAWAAGWFLSLMKARRVGGDVERAVDGLYALGIRVEFAEDMLDKDPKAAAPGGEGE